MSSKIFHDDKNRTSVSAVLNLIIKNGAQQFVLCAVSKLLIKFILLKYWEREVHLPAERHFGRTHRPIRFRLLHLARA